MSTFAGLPHYAQLTETNYADWSVNTKALLQSQKLWRLVNGTQTKPSSESINGKSSRQLAFSEVLHVPDLGNNLFSILTLTERKGFVAHIEKGSIAFITSNKVTYLSGSVEPVPEYAHIASTLPMDYDLWHRRLGHLNLASLKQMYTQNRATGLAINSSANHDPICEPLH
ncbi:hypothetical protein FIBSPDRAFT_959964 [Athelia psychrophila]|uniref:GAG-pre-integrase domain-containing protein n=1 Tax=Athelia psychrophila TaxID=1759441 RepID=A0A166CY86_9AGAM|nr:hypothetical protein FIBSPDRAFT_959964 [Fibularhizoctonia sp. CBS 109695]